MQEAVAVTTAIQEEIFLEMGIGKVLFNLLLVAFELYTPHHTITCFLL